jgi:hypothetical protein
MEHKIIKLFLYTGLILLISNSCYYDKEEELYKYNHVATCDLTNVTYNSTIVPILNSNCNICHNTSTAAGGIILDNYTELVKHMDRVWGSVNHSSGFSGMPKDGNMLTTCEISKIQAWMDKGTPNN